MVKKTSLMKLNIMTESNKPLQTIKEVFNNALQTKIETHQEGNKISTTTTTTTTTTTSNDLYGPVITCNGLIVNAI